MNLGILSEASVRLVTHAAADRFGGHDPVLPSERVAAGWLLFSSLGSPPREIRLPSRTRPPSPPPSRSHPRPAGPARGPGLLVAGVPKLGSSVCRRPALARPCHLPRQRGHGGRV